MNAINEQQRWSDFVASALPSTKHERWKYADLSFLRTMSLNQAKPVDLDSVRQVVQAKRLPPKEAILLVVVNGYFMPALSDMSALPATVMLDDASTVMPTVNVAFGANPFVEINSEFSTGGLRLTLPERCQLAQPIHLLSIATADTPFHTHPNHHIVLDKQSHLMLLDEYVAMTQQAYLMNVVTTISVGANATLDYYKIQTEAPLAVHFAYTDIMQAEDSRTRLHYFAAGSAFARDDVSVHLNQPGAMCHARGFYRLQRDGQYIDHHLDINHRARRSESEMLYKGILDKQSRAVFNGRLYVAKDAQKITAYQANHHLLLSKNAEAYSKPELEIYADDVKCKHGATAGQLDAEALFYLRSRGVSVDMAQRMLMEGFAEDIFRHVTHPLIRQRAEEALLCQ